MTSLEACGKTKQAARLRGLLRSPRVLTRELIESIINDDTTTTAGMGGDVREKGKITSGSTITPLSSIPISSSSSSSSSIIPGSTQDKQPSTIIANSNNNDDDNNENNEDNDTTLLESIDDLPYHSTTEISLSPAGKRASLLANCLTR